MEAINNTPSQLPENKVEAEKPLDKVEPVVAATGPVPVKPASNPVSPIQTAATPKNDRKYIIITVLTLGLSFLICLVVIVVIVLSLKGTTPVSTPSATPVESFPIATATPTVAATATPKPTATPTPDPYAGWRDQKLAGLGMNIKMPNNWKYEDKSIKAVPEAVENYKLHLKDPNKASNIKYEPIYNLEKDNKRLVFYGFSYGIGWCDSDPEGLTYDCPTMEYTFNLNNQTMHCTLSTEIKKTELAKLNSTPGTLYCETLPTGKSSSWKTASVLGFGISRNDLNKAGELDKMFNSITLI